MSCTNGLRYVFISGFSEPNQTPQSSKFFSRIEGVVVVHLLQGKEARCRTLLT